MISEEEKVSTRLGERYRIVAPQVILYLVRRYGIAEADAEDAVQDIFGRLVRLPAYEKLRELVGASARDFRNYVLRAAINRLIDTKRKLIRQRRNEQHLLRAVGFYLDPAELLVSDENRVRLRRAIDQLGQPYSPIFKLLVEEELSLAEIARKLGLKPGSIYVQYQRGADRLRELLNSEDTVTS